MTLNEHLTYWATRQGDATAIVFDGRVHFTYEELFQRVRQLSCLLAHEFGVATGDRVSYLGLNHPDIIALVLACEHLGAIFNPLNTRLAIAEYVYLLDNADPALCLVDANFTDMITDHREITCPVVPMSRLVTADNLTVPCAAEKKEDDALLLVYTSGTTGRPKGVLLSRRAVLANIANCQHLYQFKPGQNVQITLPLFHVGGLCILLLPALVHGATVHLHQRFDPAVTLADISENRINCSIFVPAQMAAMMALPQWQTADFSSLDYVVVGSSIIPTEQIERFHSRGIPVSQLYGATETGPAAVGLPLAETQSAVGSAGKTVKLCTIEIRDSRHRPLPPMAKGDLWVKGENLFSNYWKSPQETKAVLVDGWYNTGDIAYVDHQGYYWIVDRSKDVIISGGENIYPAEVEAVLLRHPAIVTVAVIGEKDNHWGETPVAAVEISHNDTLTLAELHSWLIDKLARFKHPKSLLVLDKLPRNVMGKIEKSVLRTIVNSSKEQD